MGLGADSISTSLSHLSKLVLAGLIRSMQLKMMTLSPSLPVSAFQVLRLQLSSTTPNCHFVELEGQFISYHKGLV